MINEDIEVTRDFEDKFDPQAYRDKVAVLYPTEWEFFLRSGEYFFKNRKIHGTTLLELGSGSAVHHIAAAAFNFSHIVQSDLTSRNREALKKWLRKDNDALNWTEVLTVAAKAHGYKDVEQGLKEMEDLIRKNVKAVIKCDVLDDPIVPPQYNVPYDLVMAPLVLESASPDHQTYRNCLRKINSLVKTSGHLILKGVLSEKDKYRVGNYFFRHLSITFEIIQNALIDAGFAECEWHMSDSYISFDKYSYIYCVCCTKVRDLVAELSP